MTVRNWKGTDNVPTTGQQIIHSTGWLNVTVKRASDENRNVGVTAELDTDETATTIKARIDPLEGNQDTQAWIGLVEPVILPTVQKGDQWLTEKPNEGIQRYKVTDINADEILLEKM